MTYMDHEHSYELVMPFVVCSSNGGEYEDGAFVAGATWATIDALLAMREHETLARYVPPPLLRQLDLSAMKHGYTMTSEPWWEHPDEWELATFVRQEL